jgi:hypothetical protein
MLIAEAFLRSLIQLYGKHVVYSDGGTWYPEAYALHWVWNIDFIHRMKRV